MTSTGYAHIELQPDSTPFTAGTRISVRRIALDHTLHGCSVEEIPEQYEGLTLGQVLSALAYYYDHREEMDRQIEQDRAELDSLRALWADSQARLLADLKARGLRP